MISDYCCLHVLAVRDVSAWPHCSIGWFLLMKFDESFYIVDLMILTFTIMVKKQKLGSIETCVYFDAHILN